MTQGNSTAQLTALTTLGVNAVKTYTQTVDSGIDVEGYGRAKTFTAETIDTDCKGRWLEKLRRKKYSFVVLGEPVSWKRGEKKRRLSSARDGAEATIIDVPRSLMPIDVDQIDFEPMAEIEDGEMFALELLDRLGLRGAECTWHLTNSHGFFGKYRARLWIALKEAATAAEMKEYAKGRWGEEKVEVDGKMKPLVDLSVYQCQQPIYTGDPILNGVASPVRNRVGHITGEALELKVAESKRKEKSGAPEDDNIAKLQEAGLYIERLKPGQHMIACPWEETHSGPERDDDTFYFEPHHNGHDIPAFKCHHGSCEEKKWTDVLEHMGETVPPEVAQTEASFSKVEDAKGPAWVFVLRRDRFWDARDGALIERKHYDATHAGVKGKGPPSERFLAMKRSEKADDLAFVPGAERFFMRGAVRVLNTYVDQRIEPDASVDASPWIDHLTWLVPQERERELLMDWLAWAYQHPEDKIAWGPILYSRSFGVGKTSVFNCFAECVGRAHMSEPSQSELEDKFNDWAFGKLLVKIEELRSNDRYHVAEKLKPVVSNYANVCASTNHMNALPIERGDRRWMLIQCVEAEKHVRRPRMKAFHRRLAEVGHGGIAHWLDSRDVSDFQPKGEAPMTKLRGIVAESSMTDLDRAFELCDAFDKADLVSSAMVEDYLRQNMPDPAVDRIVNQLGNIAYRRGWKSPSKVVTGGQDKMRVGGKRPTFWLPTGRGDAYKRLLSMSGEARGRAYEALLAKTRYNEASSDE